MDFGFRSVIKVNLLNLFGIYPAEQCRNLASLVRLPSEPRIVARPEGDSVPSVLTARHIEVRSWPLCCVLGHAGATARQGVPRQVSATVSSTANSVKFDTGELFVDLASCTCSTIATALGASRATVCRVLANQATCRAVRVRQWPRTISSLLWLLCAHGW
jgi:hypothetical protein